jgi:two-component system, chemotaxis family, sensor kinase CheA
MSKLAKYLALFMREAAEHLTSLQQGLLQLEQQPENGELLQVLLRNAHTVKGSARMLGLESIGSIAHRMEDLFKAISEGQTRVTPGVVDLLLAASDMLGTLVAASERGDDGAIDLTPLLQGFDRGELVLPLAVAPVAEVVPADTATASAVRVPVANLDRMSRYFGELELVRQRLAARLASFKHDRAPTCPQGEQVDAALLRFSEDLRDLESLLEDLAAQNRKLRMLPLRTVTESFARTVRDLARAHGKEVKVAISGDELEVDRLVLAELRPAFTHLLTNAIAHGIELPAERVAAGKSPGGELRITAWQEGETFSISLRDDGKGMSPALIRAAAVQQGILTAEQAAELSDDESLYLTLRHGFTTQEQVGSISGRGVGLDVVAAQLRKIKGSILITSEPGNFCELSLILPRSLMSMEGVVVSCSSERYIIPAAHVVESLTLTGQNLSRHDGSLVYADNPSMPVISLADLFGLPQKPLMSRQPAVVVRHRERRLLCLVDALLEAQSVVVLRLSRQFVAVKFVIGATLLADGEPVLILNVQDLFAVVRGEYCPLQKGNAPQETLVEQPKRILVVDDSVTSRNLEATILRAQGYLVTTADDGAEALALLDRQQFDMVISDNEMPQVNGIELTTQLRKQYSAAVLPVMMVSSLRSDEVQRQAFAAGVQAYMVKGLFDQDRFLTTIQQLTATPTACAGGTQEENS